MTGCPVDELVERFTQEVRKATSNPEQSITKLRGVCADRMGEPYHTEYLWARQQCHLAGGQTPPSKDLVRLPGILCCTLAVALRPHHYLDLAIPSQILPTVHLRFTEAYLRSPRPRSMFLDLRRTCRKQAGTLTQAGCL